MNKHENITYETTATQSTINNKKQRPLIKQYYNINKKQQNKTKHNHTKTKQMTTKVQKHI